MENTVALPAEKIQMVDLQAQYRRLQPEIDAAMQSVIDTAAFINGPDVKAFGSELASWLGVQQVIPCANGTDALQIALMALDLRPGGEILVSAFNYMAAAEVIAFLGFKPVFVDADPHVFNMNPALIEAAITENTVAIIPVHLFGQCMDMAPVLEIAAKYNIKVVEDVAQAIGARYQMPDGTWHVAGAMGHAGTTSFFPSKNLGCMGDGGAMYTNDAELGARLQMIANHGQKKKYTYEIVGVNSRLDTLQAALLRVKLRHLDEFTQHRQWAADYYDRVLGAAGITTPARAGNSTHVYHQYTIQVPNRDGVKQRLQDAGVPTMVYYPSPLHLQVALQGFGYTSGAMPVAEELCTKVLSLPIHSEISQEHLAYICEQVIRAV